MFCAFLVAVCNMFYPMITRNIINDLIPNRNLQLMAFWFAALLGIYILKYFLNFLSVSGARNGCANPAGYSPGYL